MAMIDLNDIILFNRVVEAGSFSAAARGLNLHKQTISRRIASIEEQLGARLLQRDTRKMRLTEVGEEISTHAQQLAHTVSRIEQTAQDQGNHVQGVLRMTAPPILAEIYLSSIITEYLAHNPNVRVDIMLSDVHESIIEGGFDLALCVGSLEDSNLVARRIGHVAAVCCASPAYIEASGLPLSPDDLRKHRCIGHGCGAQGSRWTLECRGKSEVVGFEPVLRCGSMRMVLDAAVAGIGVARMPLFICREAIAAGKLQVVLAGWRTDYGTLSAVYPSRKHISAKVREFLRLLEARPPSTLV